ncbi:UpxY family transcription antiterminator [Flavobacterium sp. CYK-55]|uniref:UpxY family transcription antiterminator n=1 Tax=Flavobacterium sp. CYK-55 TaxID=2835529 RepID=UPI0020BE8B61|nr:UpxY family transcription antiterminator [Flavobacterium sp. CYK-55]
MSETVWLSTNQLKHIAMNWFVLYTKPRTEKKVAERLAQMGVEVYCPLVTTIKQWSDRKKKIQEPLLSSYVFVRLDEKERNLVFQVSGVVRYVYWLGRPAVVRDEEIEALQEHLQNALASYEVSAYKIGDVISIPAGPFQGKEGMIRQLNKNSLQLVLSELGVLITLHREEL